MAETIIQIVARTIRQHGPISAGGVYKLAPKLNKGTVRRCINDLKRLGRITATEIGYKYNLEPNGMPREVDITPLKNSGWEYVQNHNLQFGKWIDPFTGAYHSTDSALKYQAERDAKNFKRRKPHERSR